MSRRRAGVGRVRGGRRDRGASAVEYGLLVGGIVATFLAGAIGLQGAVGALIGGAVSSVQDDTPAATATP
jgi:Flp pilus assembly pilin Flp